MSKLYSTMFNGPQTTPEQEAALETDPAVKKADEETKRQLENMTDAQKWALFGQITSGK